MPGLMWTEQFVQQLGEEAEAFGGGVHVPGDHGGTERVAEPLTHLNTPPLGRGDGGTNDTALSAMEYSFFHWGVHPWSMYAVTGLAIGYFAYRKRRGNLISAAFYPLLGERAAQGPGKAIDVIAIFATLFGSATSLGLGALQITGGLDKQITAIRTRLEEAKAIRAEAEALREVREAAHAAIQPGRLGKIEEGEGVRAAAPAGGAIAHAR